MMIKRTVAFVVLVALCAALTGCKDSHEAVMKDMISVMKDLTATLKTIEDKESAEKAKSKIEKIAERMKKLKERADELGEPDEDLARKAWEANEGAILEDWIREHPGTRPFAWWRWSAPEPRRRMLGERLGHRRPEANLEAYYLEFLINSHLKISLGSYIIYSSICLASIYIH